MATHCEGGDLGGPGNRWDHRDDGLPIDPDLAPDDPGEPSRIHRPIPHVHRARQFAVLAAIALGGFIGALARYGTERAWPSAPNEIPWATLLVNTSGAFLLGLLLTLLLERAKGARHLRPFLCIGVIGSWTTMSTFAVEVDLLIHHGHLLIAAAYVAMTTVLGVGTGWIGMTMARRLDPRRASWVSS